MDEDGESQTPTAVIGSIAAGVAPLPFLAIYAVLFIVHGFIYPVSPPDVTTSRHGEAIAGIVALALFVIVTASIWWFLNGRRRWLFVLGQLATLGTSIDFMLDATTGSPAVPFVLALTSATALVLAFLAPSWLHVGREPWRRPSSRPAHGVRERESAA